MRNACGEPNKGSVKVQFSKQFQTRRTRAPVCFGSKSTPSCPSLALLGAISLTLCGVTVDALAADLLPT
jgi:hypothetical protein